MDPHPFSIESLLFGPKKELKDQQNLQLQFLGLLANSLIKKPNQPEAKKFECKDCGKAKKFVFIL